MKKMPESIRQAVPTDVRLVSFASHPTHPPQVRFANVLPIIREAQKAGAATLRDIASALNARGVATARGGQWYAKSVANILERA
jgi:hypothetical protein